MKLTARSTDRRAYYQVREAHGGRGGKTPCSRNLILRGNRPTNAPAGLTPVPVATTKWEA